jgi:hypothetical protein
LQYHREPTSSKFAFFKGGGISHLERKRRCRGEHRHVLRLRGRSEVDGTDLRRRRLRLSAQRKLTPLPLGARSEMRPMRYEERHHCWQNRRWQWSVDESVEMQETHLTRSRRLVMVGASGPKGSIPICWIKLRSNYDPIPYFLILAHKIYQRSNCGLYSSRALHVSIEGLKKQDKLYHQSRKTKMLLHGWILRFWILIYFVDTLIKLQISTNIFEHIYLPPGFNWCESWLYVKFCH